MILTYAVFRVIWWVLLGVLLCGFAVMDGFDLGAAALIPWVGSTDAERRAVINTVGPVWEGNQVWFILGGGAIFAAWPSIYAVSFSGFYLAMFLVLLTFIMRPVGFKYRSKLASTSWRTSWDWILSIAAFIAALVFGVAVGNTLQGVPFYFDDNLRSFYTGTLWQLFNPFALLCGLTSVVMIVMQGAYYLVVKTEAAVRERSMRIANLASVLLILLFAVGGVWVSKYLSGYTLTKIASYNGPSNPLIKEVGTQLGAWMINYSIYPLAWLAPFFGFLGALSAIILVRVGLEKLAFVCSSLSVIGVVATVGVSMFPFILPSSSVPNSSLLVWDASASETSLKIMTISTIIFMPIILAYTAWVFRVMRGKVNSDFLEKNKDAAY